MSSSSDAEDEGGSNLGLRLALETARSECGDARMSDRLSRCLESLSKYPLPLRGRQCLLLEGFNKEVLKRVQEHMKEDDGDNEEEKEDKENKGEVPVSVPVPAPAVSPIPKRFKCLGDETRGEKEQQIPPPRPPAQSRRHKSPPSSTCPPPEAERTQEELDHELALRLSREINNQEAHDREKDEASGSQEEDDYKLALRLQAMERRISFDLGNGGDPTGEEEDRGRRRKKASENFVDTGVEGGGDSEEDSFEARMAEELAAPSLAERVGGATAAAVSASASDRSSSSSSTVCITPPPPAVASQSDAPLAKIATRTPVPMRLGVVGVHDMSSSADEEDEEESAVVRQPAPLAAAVHEISDSSSEAEDKGQEESSRSKKTAAAALPSRRGRGRGGRGGGGGGRGGCRATGTRARAGGGSKKKAGGISIEEEYPAWARDAATFNSSSTAAASASSDRHEAEFRLLPGEFEVVLLVDTAEICGGEQGGHHSRKRVTLEEMASRGVRHEVRKLNVGDFAWVARENNPRAGCTPRELVLPHVVERKRVDDLLSSLRDHRYKEQKWRLARCGISNAIYLVEEFGRYKAEKYGGSMEAVETALISTSTTPGFSVKHTDSQRDSMAYLARMTSLLSQEYGGRTLTSCTKEDIDRGLVVNRSTTLISFKEFYENSRKSPPLSCSEVFVRLLMQLRGVTHSSASSVAGLHPTLGHLVRAYWGSGGCPTEGEGEGGRRLSDALKKAGVGNKASRAIAALCDQQLEEVQ